MTTADAMKQLADANPVRTTRTDHEQALLTQLLRQPGDPRLLDARARHRGRPRSPRARSVLIFASILVASVAAATVSLTRSQESAAAAVLRNAATSIGTTRQGALPAGSYWYIRTRVASSAAIGFTLNLQDRTAFLIESRTAETWVANDGSGATYSTLNARSPLNDAGRRAFRQLQRTHPAPQPRSNGMLLEGPNLIAATFGPRTLTPATLANLPNNETVLRRLLDATRGGASSNAKPSDIAQAEFEQVANALFYEPFNPKIISTLYRMLALVPGVHTLGPARDALGRPGLELAVDGTTTRETLLIDTATGQTLERSEIKTASDANDAQVPIGATTFRQTMLKTGIVPGIATRPDGSRLTTKYWTTCKPRPNQANDTGAAHCTDPPRAHNK